MAQLPDPRHHVHRTSFTLRSSDEDARAPTGRCNYTNLNAAGSRCGCQRFTDQATAAEVEVSLNPALAITGYRAGFCMCEHHACYHDNVPAPVAASVEPHPPPVRGPSLPAAAFARSFTSGQLGGTAFREQVLAVQTAGPRERVDASITQIGIEPRAGGSSSRSSRVAESDLPDTMQWNAVARSASTVTSGLPPIPAECLLGSQSSHERHSIRPTRFQTQAARAVSLPAPTHRPSEPRTLPTRIGSADEDEGRVDSAMMSVTDVITPSLRGSPELSAGPDLHATMAGIREVMETMEDMAQAGAAPRSPIVKPDLDSQRSFFSPPPRPARDDFMADHHHAVMTLSGHLGTLAKHVGVVPSMRSTIKNHEYRLDHLENGSFTNNPYHEEMNDRMDLFDGRVIEAENRIDELEKSHAALVDTSRVSTPQASFHGAARDVSQASEASAAHSAVAGPSEWTSRVEALETEVVMLRALAPPTHSRPWEVEVIFLPFGFALKGIWSTMENFRHQRSRSTTAAGEEWTQAPYGSIPPSQLLLNEALERKYDERDAPYSDNSSHEWYLARACAKGSRVEERLRSRGLVKTIQIKGPDARDVHAAISLAFDDLPDVLAAGPTNNPAHLADSPDCASFWGLQASWIPLRKLHRDSRLRFLDHTEIVTPALWTASFLSSNVVMRSAGTRRLFVTHRQSYLQHRCDAASSWSWAKLRDLPRPSRESSPDLAGDVVPEACWEHDERLDPTPSPQSSFSSYHSSLSLRQAAQEGDGDQSPTDPVSDLRVVLSPGTESPPHPRAATPDHLLRPQRVRTFSMPCISISPTRTSPHLAKRRIASSVGTQPKPSSMAATPFKRLRLSRSPSRPRDTPRWSIGPPSPHQARDTSEKRATTPFAYATPHSNTPYPDFRSRSVGAVAADDDGEAGSATDDADAGADGSGFDLDDTDVDETMDYGHGQPDDEWQGVADDDRDSGMDHNALSDAEEVDGGAAAAARDPAVVDRDDARSDASSAPSEYPSTQAAAAALFEIHADAVEEMAGQAVALPP